MTGENERGLQVNNIVDMGFNFLCRSSFLAGRGNRRNGRCASTTSLSSYSNMNLVGEGGGGGSIYLSVKTFDTHFFFLVWWT